MSKSSNTVRLIRVEAHIEEKKLLASDNFVTIVNLMSPRSKLISQSMKMRVDHQKNVNDFYSPKSLPELFVSENPKDNTVTLSVQNDDPYITSVDVYVRRIYSLPIFRLVVMKNSFRK